MGTVARTFIVRVWIDVGILAEQVEAEGRLSNKAPSGWRASVTSASGLERRYFANPTELVAFLTGRAPPPDLPVKRRSDKTGRSEGQ